MWRGRVVRGDGAGGGGGGEPEPANSVWMLFADFLLVFSNSFSVLPVGALERHGFHEDCSWTRETCGGTPIPIKQPVFGSNESWGRNPQFIVQTAAEGGEGEYVEVVALLQQRDPRAYGKFPFAENLEEIFMCVSEVDKPERLRVFDKAGVRCYSRRFRGVPIVLA